MGTGELARAPKSFVCLMEQDRVAEAELPPLTKRALGLAKGTVPDDWNYKDVLSEALLEKYGATP